MSKPWTEAHRREALRRTYEIAGELLCSKSGDGIFLAETARHFVGSEARWRAKLARGTGLDPASVDREVVRVRALAEGRLSRETVYRALDGGGGLIREETDAHFVADLAALPGVRIVRVTRIRRAR